MEKFQPRVMDLTAQELRLLGEARQQHGNEIYGDRDQLRDGALDMIEECLDIVNILNRRLKWLLESNISNEKIGYLTNCILENTIKNMADIQQFDQEIREAGYIVDDSNGGERLGFDYLEHCKLAAEAHKGLE